MIECMVINYLATNLSVPVYMEVPESSPLSFVVLEKTGSKERDHIFSATFAVQSYAESLLGAAQLNENVKIAMRNITELESISSSKLNSDYNYTDPDKMKYRYQAVFEIVYK